MRSCWIGYSKRYQTNANQQPVPWYQQRKGWILLDVNWKRHVSHTCVFMNIIFPFLTQHCRGITGKNISLWKNIEVQSFVCTMIDIHGAVILYRQFNQHLKPQGWSKHTPLRTISQAPAPSLGYMWVYLALIWGKIDWRYLPELCQSPHFHSGSEHTLPVLGSGPWWSKVWKK